MTLATLGRLLVCLRISRPGTVTDGRFPGGRGLARNTNVDRFTPHTLVPLLMEWPTGTTFFVRDRLLPRQPPPPNHTRPQRPERFAAHSPTPWGVSLLSVAKHSQRTGRLRPRVWVTSGILCATSSGCPGECPGALLDPWQSRGSA